MTEEEAMAKFAAHAAPTPREPFPTPSVTDGLVTDHAIAATKPDGGIPDAPEGIVLPGEE